MGIAIEFKNVTKSFWRWDNRPPRDIKSYLRPSHWLNRKDYAKTSTTVLDGVSFQIRQGEFVGIMGRNGIGKSTILKLISGIYFPTKGEITTCGAVAPLLELGAGFNEDLSGYENIFLNAAILGFGRKRTLETIDQIIGFAELEKHIHQPVRNYSSGMQVRLGFAIAAHLDAPIILLDEVLGVGDLAFYEKCTRKIHELHRQGRTIVLVTHDPNQVATICSRCIMLEKGRVVYDGDPTGGADTYVRTITGHEWNQPGKLTPTV